MLTTLLGSLTADQFLKQYWQKQPLFISNALPEYQSPITPDELAGLACETDVESRLVLEHDGVRPWECRHGPFEETDFATLPESHWTLLIQECNKIVPDLSELLELFNFIPNWRVDDVMVSFAVAQGSVGPHVDQYDVFLIQAHGTRRWQIDTRVTPEAPLIPDTDLRILQKFEAEQEWISKPGDMLYLPPGVAHYGIALEDCITLSVGFRAPSHYELLCGFVDALQTLEPTAIQHRYRDPDLTLQENPGEITAHALDKITHLIQHSVSDPHAIRRWFGRFITEPKHNQQDMPLDDPFGKAEFLTTLEQDTLYRSEDSRFAYVQWDGHTTLLYIDGQEITLTGDARDAAPLLCNQRSYYYEDIRQYIANEEAINLLIALTNEGKLYFEEQD